MEREFLYKLANFRPFGLVSLGFESGLTGPFINPKSKIAQTGKLNIFKVIKEVDTSVICVRIFLYLFVLKGRIRKSTLKFRRQYARLGVNWLP